MNLRNVLLLLSMCSFFTTYTSFVVFLDRDKICQYAQKKIIPPLDQKAEKELKKICESIAKRKGAYAVIDKDCAWLYVDPEYDITEEVVSLLIKDK